ncbi:hypothetical protein Q5752_000917 [Cryptotrichosporon argae]
MSVSKLKFKGDKPKKKKRTHREVDDNDDEAALALADPKGWVFPTDVAHIAGPSFVLLPTEPLTCLAWDPQRQRVYAAPVDVPLAPEGAADLSPNEILQAVEPSDVNHVWVVARLSGSEDVVSLRSSSGTFLTAHPSGTLSASNPSRGPLESLTPDLFTPSSSSSSSSSSPFPSLTLKTHAETYLSAPPASALEATSGSKRPGAELRGDAEVPGAAERFWVKCQREFVWRAKGGGEKRRKEDEAGGVEDEMRRNREAQTWGAGRALVSTADRKALKKAAKDGRYAEAMLDRRAALKSDKFAK